MLIIAQSHPSLAASSRWTLEKQQHDGRAAGSDTLPLGIPLMVEESKRVVKLGPPAPKPCSNPSFRPGNPVSSTATPPPPSSSKTFLK